MEEHGGNLKAEDRIAKGRESRVILIDRKSVV
jgi:hypothetical protein